MTESQFLKEDLVELRNSLGLTQQQMAGYLDMALRSYQAIEAGESTYRLIHRLAAERVALMVAADTGRPLLAPPTVRRDAVDLVSLGQREGHPAFQIPDSNSSNAKPSEDGTAFTASYKLVGELVLLANALEYQLNHVLMQVLHLTESPMLEPVIATLDVVRKIEMLKVRSKHIAQHNWRKPLAGYLDKLEAVWKLRNLACHTPLIPDSKHGAVFAPAAAAKLLKTLRLENSSIERTPISKIKEGIAIGEHALGEGQTIVENFQRLNSEREKRFGKVPSSKQA
jgi:transcriptional regulator with XRE-family HTH domain